MDSFYISANAVVPFIVYIGFGIILKKAEILSRELARNFNSVVFRGFFPIMIFYNLYKSRHTIQFSGSLLITAMLVLSALIVVRSLIVRKTVKDPSKQPVIVQAVYRSNVLLFALPIAQSIYGDEAAATATMLLAVIVPFYNMSSILLFEFFRGGKADPRRLFRKVITNPLILGALVGLVSVAVKFDLPSSLDKSLSNISGMCTPMACIILGATLQSSSIRKHVGYIVPTLAAKLILLPLLSLPLSMALGFSAMERFVFFSIFATPIASSSFPMARSMGGDGDLAGELLAASTLCSIVTISLWIMLFNRLGILY